MLIIGDELQCTIELAAALHGADKALILAHGLRCLTLRQADCLGLLVVVGQHQIGNRVGHAGQQRIALLGGHVLGSDHLVQQNLDIDLMVGAVNATGIVDKVGIERSAGQTKLDTAQLRQPQIAALTYYTAAQVAAVDAQGVVGLVTHIGVGLHAALDVGTNAAVPDQIDRRLEQLMNQLGWRQALGLDTKAGAHLWGQRDLLETASEHPAAFGDQAAVVVGPAGARQRKQALTFLITGFRVRIGVDKDMLVVECRHQLEAARLQQAIAEHVAGHVADPDHADRIGLHIQPQLAEVPLHRDPGAARCNAHFLVVVPGRAARGERIAQPETVTCGNFVGDIGEGSGALVGRHHQVRVVAVMAHHVGWRHHLAVDQVVGDIQQALDKQAVAGNRLLLHLIAAATQRQPARNKAALGANGHDHRILHLLGLDQPQHLGAVILFAVGPAQPATGHLATAQVHTLNTR